MSKDFKEAAAMQFISKPQDERKVKKQDGFIEIQKKVRETKSKALNLLIKPSIYTALKEEAKNKDMSINEIANQLFEHYVNR